jgi:hypothetical protein
VGIQTSINGYGKEDIEMAAFIPLIAAVVSAGAGMYASSQASSAQSKAADDAREAQYAAEQRAVQRQKELAAENQKNWEQNAFPKDMDQKRSALTAELGSAKTNAFDQFARKASIMGWGPGSGAIAKGGAGIESSYLSSLGKGLTDLNKYAATPMWASPNGSTIGMVNQSYYPAYTNQGSNPLGTAMGYMAGKYGQTSVPGQDDYTYLHELQNSQW